MRPTPRKKTPSKPKARPVKPEKVRATDAERKLIVMRRHCDNALAEIKLAREYMAKSFSGPEHEHLEWAQSAIENALAGKK